MLNYWERRLDICNTCLQPLSISRTFDGHPSMLSISIAGMMTKIDKEILFESVRYSIFAVGYRGAMHFISLIRLQNEIFEYDGMIQDGLLRLVGNSIDLLTNEIIYTSNRKMKAVLIWYTKMS